MTAEIARVGVVVPAHNEERLLTACLSALQTAARSVSVPVDVLVVLDDCTDKSLEVCQRLRVKTLSISARNVGAARGVGLVVLIGDERNADSLWLASTDADSQVEPTWLRDQLEMARSGAGVVVGMVRLAGNSTPPDVQRAFEADYQDRFIDGGAHDHVHGANLGLRASAYLRVGRLPPFAQPRGQAPHQTASPHAWCDHRKKPTDHRFHQRPTSWTLPSGFRGFARQLRHSHRALAIGSPRPPGRRRPANVGNKTNREAAPSACLPGGANDDAALGLWVPRGGCSAGAAQRAAWGRATRRGTTSGVGQGLAAAAEGQDHGGPGREPRAGGARTTRDPAPPVNARSPAPG